jgi:antitoxin (DNA-binding transcriptional repressor) of toxin-antitoxin stability system
MRRVNLHEAETHLSRLVAQAVAGECFVICKAGVPLVQVTRLADAETLGHAPQAPPRPPCRSVFGSRGFRSVRL